MLIENAILIESNIFSPLNISATLDDISHILQIVNPTHVATIAPKLDLVKAALASNSMTRTKIFTVLSKVDSFPQVSDTCHDMSLAAFIDITTVPRRCYQ
jgi:hypothetical protein